MSIETDKEFEEKLGQLCRLYRAMRQIWSVTESTDQTMVASWVIEGGRIMELLSDVLGDIEEYSGCMDLRLIVDQMKTIRQERAGNPERA